MVLSRVLGGRTCWKKSLHKARSCRLVLAVCVGWSRDTWEHPPGDWDHRRRLSPILSALLSLLGIIKENGCFPEPGPGPSALPALPKSPCNKFIGITLPSPNPGPSPCAGDLKGLGPVR